MKKSYIYADGQILAQYDGDPAANPPADIYFYLHDRLGSVRQVIDAAAAVANHYTYEPYGDTIESSGTFPNPWRFTGQYYDAEIHEYHLRARQYNPVLARFTARDPVFGRARQPLTLNQYLYCVNDPANRRDLLGNMSTTELVITEGIEGAIWGALGGATEGLIHELFEYANGGEFDVTDILINAGAGAGAGFVVSASLAYKMGTAIRNIPTAVQWADFAFGVIAGAGRDVIDSRRGALGLAKVDAGVAVHNIAVNAMAESVNQGW